VTHANAAADARAVAGELEQVEGERESVSNRDSRLRVTQTITTLDLLRARFRGNRTRLRLREERFRGQIVKLQSLVRIALAKKIWSRRLQQLINMQSVCRTVLHTRAYRRLRASAIIVQKYFRCFRVWLAYYCLREATIFVQSAERGRRHRLQTREQRLALLEKMRVHVFELWRRANTSLVYRSRFWTLFDGDGFLSLAVHEDEIRKLWGELNLLPPDFDSGALVAYEALSEEADKAPAASPMAFPDLMNHASLALAEYGETGTPGLQFSRATAALSRNPTPAPAADGSMYFTDKPRASTVVAAGRLKEERRLLYQRLKHRQFNGQRESFFKLFEVSSRKRRKQTLAAQVWEHVDQAEKSAQVVLATFDSGTLGRVGEDFALNKMQQRIRHDMLSTVQACLTSIRDSHRRKHTSKAHLGRERAIERTHKESLRFLTRRRSVQGPRTPEQRSRSRSVSNDSYLSAIAAGVAASPRFALMAGDAAADSYIEVHDDKTLSILLKGSQDGRGFAAAADQDDETSSDGAQS